MFQIIIKSSYLAGSTTGLETRGEHVLRKEYLKHNNLNIIVK